jgi:hypothetical protein
MIFNPFFGAEKALSVRPRRGRLDPALGPSSRTARRERRAIQFWRCVGRKWKDLSRAPASLWVVSLHDF